MRLFRFLANDPARLLQLSTLDCLSARQFSILPSLSRFTASQHARESQQVHHPSLQAADLTEARRPFSTSCSLLRGGFGQSETENSLRRKATVQEEPPARLSDDELGDLDEEPDEDIRRYRMSEAAAADLLSDGDLLSSDQLASTPLSGTSLSLQAQSDPRRRDKNRPGPGRGGDDLETPRFPVDTSIAEAAMAEWLGYFRMKVVDVNRTSRGSPTGGIGRFSALVVVGNSNGVLGLGMGKSTEIGAAIKKANRQALKTLFFVPRYHQTILHPLQARYGRCKVIMYPRSTGSGCKASHMVTGICKLAGIQDIGVKVHGTRNVRNTVKALIRCFEAQIVEEEHRELPSAHSQAALEMLQAHTLRAAQAARPSKLLAG